MIDGKDGVLEVLLELLEVLHHGVVLLEGVHGVRCSMLEVFVLDFVMEFSSHKS